MTRVYTDQPLAIGATVQLDAGAAHHVVHVLRMRLADPLTLFNGHGGEYLGSIVDVGRHTVAVQLSAFDDTVRESPLRTTLVQGISRAERMDYTIQKAVELGVTHIIPIRSERSVVRLDAERADKRQQHWQSVATSAAEQCGRSSVPVVETVTSLSAWLGRPAIGIARLWLQAAGTTTAAALPAGLRDIALIIGPEGGFAPGEHAQLAAAGCTAVALGPRILRTETAALVALAILQARYGDLAAAGT